MKAFWSISKCSIIHIIKKFFQSFPLKKVLQERPYKNKMHRISRTCPSGRVVAGASSSWSSATPYNKFFYEWFFRPFISSTRKVEFRKQCTCFSLDRLRRPERRKKVHIRKRRPKLTINFCVFLDALRRDKGLAILLIKIYIQVLL